MDEFLNTSFFSEAWSWAKRERGEDRRQNKMRPSLPCSTAHHDSDSMTNSESPQIRKTFSMEAQVVRSESVLHWHLFSVFVSYTSGDISGTYGCPGLRRISCRCSSSGRSNTDHRRGAQARQTR